MWIFSTWGGQIPAVSGVAFHRHLSAPESEWWWGGSSTGLEERPVDLHVLVKLAMRNRARLGGAHTERPAVLCGDVTDNRPKKSRAPKHTFVYLVVFIGSASTRSKAQPSLCQRWGSNQQPPTKKAQIPNPQSHTLRHHSAYWESSTRSHTHSINKKKKE